MSHPPSKLLCNPVDKPTNRHRQNPDLLGRGYICLITPFNLINNFLALVLAQVTSDVTYSVSPHLLAGYVDSRGLQRINPRPALIYLMPWGRHFILFWNMSALPRNLVTDQSCNVRKHLVEAPQFHTLRLITFQHVRCDELLRSAVTFAFWIKPWLLWITSGSAVCHIYSIIYLVHIFGYLQRI